MNTPVTNDRFHAFTIEEFEVNGDKRSVWHKIGAAWPHRDCIS